MARRDPGNAGVERIEERRLPFPLRFRDPDVERGPHDKALQFRLHHAVRTAGAGQPDLVALHSSQVQTSAFRPQLSAAGCELSVLYTPFERWDFVVCQGFKTAGFSVHACRRASSINAGAWKPSGKIGQLQSAGESSAT
jgi:hypothetical protein